MEGEREGVRREEGGSEKGEEEQLYDYVGGGSEGSKFYCLQMC